MQVNNPEAVIGIIREMINHYYEWSAETSSEIELGQLRQLVFDIDTMINFENEEED